jgi:hypothetical protein
MISPHVTETNNPEAHQPAVLPTPAATNPLGYGIPPSSLPSSSSLPLTHHAYLGTITDRDAKSIVDKAFQEVKGADRRTRLLMQIETDARRLALTIQDYEDYMKTPEGQQADQQELAAQNMKAATASAHGADISMEDGGAPGQSDAPADGSRDTL